MAPSKNEIKVVLPSPSHPTRCYLGEGAFKKIESILAESKSQSVLLVLGEKSFHNTPHFKTLNDMLKVCRSIKTLCVPNNPTQDYVQTQINLLKNQSFDLVVGIGGGSVLDTAKLLASIPLQTDLNLASYLQNPGLFQIQPQWLIAVPTTAGTGSEVTPYASLETSTGHKVSIEHTYLIPSIAILDPELTYSMPPYVTACTGFDALCQAIESYWSLRANPESREHALSALSHIDQNLLRAYENPTNAFARSEMLLGSFKAGLAIASTKTTAIHAVSYPITTHFKIAHGHACALTLASFIRFNAPDIFEPNRLAEGFNCISLEAMAKKVEQMMDAVNLKRSLNSLGIDRKGMELILRDGFRPDRIKNNPRSVTRDDLESLLNTIQ